MLFCDAFLQVIALCIMNGSLYHNHTLHIYACSNSCTIQVKKLCHNASAQSASKSESMVASAATKKPRHEKSVSDNKPTTTLSMAKECLQSVAATHCNSIAKGALKYLLAKELKQGAIAQHQKKRQACGNMPSQKQKAKTATLTPK